MPLFIAHRGASFAAPENTLAAFSLARQMGAQGFEFDVQRCASGELVLFHDWDLCRTSDYAISHPISPSGIVPVVVDLPWAELQKVDVGAWKSEKFKGEKIPLFEAVLQFSRPDEFLDIEVKVRGKEFHGLEQELLRLLEKYDVAGRCAISSFNPLFVRRFKHLTQKYPLGLISEAKPPWIRNRKMWLRVLKPQYLFVQFHPRVEEDLAWAKLRGIKVMVWTVDSFEEMKLALALGVDGVISNRADLLSEMPADLKRLFSGRGAALAARG